MRDFVKEAEQNIVNQAVFFKDLISVIDILGRATRSYFPEYNNRDKEDFSKGMNLIYSALHSQYVKRQSDLLIFASIGGEEAKQFSLNKFKEMYGKDAEERYSIMHFLDKFGNTPANWLTDEEEQFREQLAGKLD